ncbi:MAG: CotH kinase family protein [Bacteroidetes bacterium]|nr:CotH kinase family protein [Bacteroidota bacterium]
MNAIVFLLLAFFFGASTSIYATSKVYVATGGKLDTFKKGNWFPLHIASASPVKLSDTYGIEYINIKIKCAQAGLLGVFLQSPTGVSYQLSWLNGGSKANFDSTFFTDTANNPVHFGKAPFKGAYNPECFLKLLNYSEMDTGTWNLIVYDYNTFRKDVLVNWSIGFGNNPNRDFKLDSSNLPIFVINTQGYGIPASTAYAPSKFHVIENSTGGHNYAKDSLLFPGYGGIRLHGNWSRSFPKQSYTIITYDASYKKKNMKLLGMPKEHDWVLQASFLDKSLMRNSLAQHMFSGMGNYSPRTRNVELIINGRYQGVYTLIESIKIDKNRVNIPKTDTITCNTGDSLTGGYIIKQDWNGSAGWSSKYFKPDYNAWYPYIRFDAPDLPSVQQAKYIRAVYDSFEDVLYNGTATSRAGIKWRDYMDEKSMIDYMFLQEISTNVDGYRASYHMWKDRNSVDKHIHLGPGWDFDITFGNYWASWSSWFFNNGWCNSDFWLFKLMGNKYPIIPKFTTAWYNYGPGDTSFRNNVKCRWTVYRRAGGVLNQISINHWIDSNSTELSEGQVHNFKEWPGWGWSYLYKPNYAKNYKQEVDSLKRFLLNRMVWMDKNMPGTCRLDIDPPTVKLNGFDTALLEVYYHYKDSGIVYHDKFGDSNVVVTDTTNLDTAHLGKYFIKYLLSDRAGNRSSITRWIKVIDTIRPSIVFLNGDTIKIEVNKVYKDSDIVIADNYDLSPIIIKGGTFNFNKNTPDSIGFFTKTIKVTDQSGNTDSAVLVIHVMDIKIPVITLKGKDTVYININDSYSDSGYTAIDDYDKTPIVDTFSTLKNTSKIGLFSITYKVKDNSGNVGIPSTRIISIANITNTDVVAKRDLKVMKYIGRGVFWVTANSPVNSPVNVSVFDALGRLVYYSKQHLNAGTDYFILNIDKEPVGVYFIKVQTADSILTKKFVVE